jgi:hypothetical protein
MVQNSTNEVCVLEFMRAMDTWEGWEEKRDKEKNDRCNSSLVFINEVTIGSAKWTASQINFTFGVRGTIRRDNCFKKLLKLGVEEARHREET